MKHNKLAFTLIELLVVVLIIGILAAVAVPQYQKAVEKSKAAQAFALLKTTYQAAQSYELANGTWPTSFEELGLDIPWTDATTKWYSSTTDSRSNAEWSLGLVSDQYLKGVLIGRASGKYKGAGFGMWSYYYHASVPRNQLVCLELPSQSPSSLTFNDAGEYCTKLFQGVRLYEDVDAWRQFRLP